MPFASRSISLLAALLAFASIGASAAPGMSDSSTSFTDGGTMSSAQAGDTGDCGGKGVSPQVAWANLPAAATSVAVILADPDGGKGLGVVHWVVYDIAAARGHLDAGEAQVDGKGFKVGKNSAGAAVYRGICPPVGDVAHHYVLTVIATDLDPQALPAGMSRDELLAALKGHGLVSQSVVGRYAR